MPTIRQALDHARSQFSTSLTPALDAQLLLCHVLDVPRAYLFAHPEQELTPTQQHSYHTLVARRADGEPVEYIRGVAGFYDRDLLVTPDVLIPRPETEQLVELALTHARSRRGLTAADIGTGSGAIAVTLAANAPGTTVYATDVSPAALAIARRNAQRAGVALHWLQGNLAEPLIAAGVQVDLLLANLPYIASDELPTLAVSRHEPHLALDGGPDGLVLIADLLRQAPQVCQPGAWILLEIGADQGPAVRAKAQALLPGAASEIIEDYAGRQRIVRIALPTDEPGATAAPRSSP